MNINELREIAEAASALDFEPDHEGWARQCDDYEAQPYIIAFHPARVIALLDCVEALQSITSPTPTAADFIDATEKAAAALKALEAA